MCVGIFNKYLTLNLHPNNCLHILHTVLYTFQQSRASVFDVAHFFSLNCDLGVGFSGDIVSKSNWMLVMYWIMGHRIKRPCKLTSHAWIGNKHAKCDALSGAYLMH